MQLNLTREKPTCNCGIMGVFGRSSASLETHYGIHALQHSGQEACGIVTQKLNGDGTCHGVAKRSWINSLSYGQEFISITILI
jgi:glutamine phosphoribosylpyrophosphate amidotransferase